MGFIYKTTNIKTGKIYVGKSKFNDPTYLGSGTILKQAIDKYGKASFIKEILEECPDEMIDLREKFWIKESRASERGIGYNITNGGTGGDTTTNHPDKGRIIKDRAKGLSDWYQSLSEEEKIDHCKKISNAKKGKSNGREGYSHSDETIDKIKNNQPPKDENWVKSHAKAMAKRKGTSMPKKYKRVNVNGIEYESVKHAVAAMGLKYAKYFHDMRRNGKIKVIYL